MKKKKKLSFHLISNFLKLSKIKKEKILHTKNYIQNYNTESSLPIPI